jgi:F0F1-type ATP synthase assembly protein I
VKRYRSALAGYALAGQISGILLCSVFSSLFAGIWLDKKLHTAPCLMLLLMMVGIAFAIYTIRRLINELPKN